MRYPKVIDVKPIEDYNVIITYETGEKKKFDVTPYIKGNWFGELKDIEIFKAVRPCGSTIESPCALLRLTINSQSFDCYFKPLLL